MKYVRPFRTAFYSTALITILLSFLAPFRTYLIKIAVDDKIQFGDTEGIKAVLEVLMQLSDDAGMKSYVFWGSTKADSLNVAIATSILCYQIKQG